MYRRPTVFNIGNQQLSQAEWEAQELFSYGPYAFSAVGLLKIVAAVVLFAAGVVFLAAPSCADSPAWFSALPPALHLTVGVLLIGMYTLFTLGFARENLKVWVSADQIILLLGAAMAATASILILASCDNKDTLHFVPAIGGLAGVLLLVVDCAALFVMWRSRFGEPEASGSRLPGPLGTPAASGMPGDRPMPRKSVFI